MEAFVRSSSSFPLLIASRNHQNVAESVWLFGEQSFEVTTAMCHVSDLDPVCNFPVEHKIAPVGEYAHTASIRRLRSHSRQRG